MLARQRFPAAGKYWSVFCKYLLFEPRKSASVLICITAYCLCLHSEPSGSFWTRAKCLCSKSSSNLDQGQYVHPINQGWWWVGRIYLCNWMYICRARPSTDPYIIQNPIPEASVWASAVTLEQQSASHSGIIQNFYRTRWPTLLISFLLIEIAIVMDNRHCHCLLVFVERVILTVERTSLPWFRQSWLKASSLCNQDKIHDS